MTFESIDAVLPKLHELLGTDESYITFMTETESAALRLKLIRAGHIKPQEGED